LHYSGFIIPVLARFIKIGEAYSTVVEKVHVVVKHPSGWIKDRASLIGKVNLQIVHS